MQFLSESVNQAPKCTFLSIKKLLVPCNELSVVYFNYESLKQANAIFVLKQKETRLSFYILHQIVIYINFELITTFEDSFVNHLLVKLISSIKTIIIMNQIIKKSKFNFF